jgi:hypothetical protein
MSSRVVPSSQTTNENNIIFYDNLLKDNQNQIAVIVIEGFGSPGPIPDETGFRIMHEINYYYYWYDTKGLISDFLTLKSDIKMID